MIFAIDLIEKLTILAPFLLAFGAGWKYLPKIRQTINEGVIPLLNALITFFVALGGGATVANAGIFGDLGHALSVPFAAFVAVTWSYVVSKVHDKFIKPLTPPSPYRLSMEKDT